MDISELMTDLNKEVEGVWCPLGKGAHAKIARYGNDEFQKEMSRKYKANRALLESDDDSSIELNRTLLIEAFAKTILKDIRGITINGNPIEKYTFEIGVKLLSVKDFFNKVKAYSENFETYQAKAEDEAVKN